MKRLLNPYWILGTITLPQIVLFLLYFYTYRIISSLLLANHLFYWVVFGSIALILCVVFTGYALACLLKNAKVHPLLGFAIFLGYLPFLYFFILFSDNVIPSDIPRWMLMQGDVILYVYTFSIPALIYGLMLLVLYFTPSEKEYWAWANFWLAGIFPATVFLFVMGISPLFSYAFLGYYERRIIEHIFVIFFVCGGITFLFFLIRFFYTLLLQRKSVWNYEDLTWKIPLTILFPLFGLHLNEVIFMRIFGDFSHISFYIIALVNGILICIPKFYQPAGRLALFFVRSISYTYIIYFFLVFLPFLPLAIPAIIVFGAGFLMLTPLAIMVIQSNILAEDFSYLRTHFSKWILSGLFLAGLALMPLYILWDYHQDRQNLYQALDEVYESPHALNSQQKINIQRITQVLQTVKSQKRRLVNDFWLNNTSESHQPFLTSLYQTIVLDNMTLSDAKIQLLEKIFLGVSHHQAQGTGLLMPEGSESVKIDSLYTESVYHPDEKYWTSWIHLDLFNQDTLTTQREFVTQINLPNGAWISNYYLKIGQRKEFGLLTEKKAAMWVYQQIVGVERRDPGLLHYLNGNQVNFRVFPFLKQEKRHTGIEITHFTPLEMIMDERRFTLGDSTKPLNKAIQAQNAVFVPASAKANLSRIQRKPYYHFIVDVSKSQKKHLKTYSDKIEKLLRKNLIPKANAKITLCNYRLQTFDLKADWKQKIGTTPFEGGFYLEKALKSILLQNYENPSHTFPVMVVVSDDKLDNALMTENLADFEITCPETQSFYVLDASGQISGNNFMTEKLDGEDVNLQQLAFPKVLAYPHAQGKTTYLADNQQDDIIIQPLNAQDFNKMYEGKNAQNALALQGVWQSMEFHPEHTQAMWLNLVKNSFRTQIMSPQTSYIVVENEAQKQALLAKQQQTLKAKQSLDTTDEMQQMSEPSWIWFVLVGLLFWSWRRWKG
jgi:hypothetical protein